MVETKGLISATASATRKPSTIHQAATMELITKYVSIVKSNLSSETVLTYNLSDLEGILIHVITVYILTHSLPTDADSNYVCHSILVLSPNFPANGIG